MKKFSKILILLLTLVVAITALTVTALATEETTETNKDHYEYDLANYGSGSVNGDLPHTKQYTGSWENATAEPGVAISNGHATIRYGYMYIGLGQDGQEKFIVSTPGNPKGDKSNGWMWDPSFPKITKKITVDGQEVNTYKYNLQDYPYFVFDFDVCSPTGDFGTGNLYNITFRTSQLAKNSGTYTLGVAFTDYSAFLDETAYNWQHVTVVSKFVPTIDQMDGTIATAIFEQTIYVNGQKVTTLTKDYTTAAYSGVNSFTGHDPEHVSFYAARFSNAEGRFATNKAAGTSALEGYDWNTFDQADITTYPGYDETTGTYTHPSLWYKESAALDNTVIHWYQDGWTADTIAKDLYDEKTYEFPFGLAIAKVGDVVYDNISKAIDAAAASGQTLQLINDVSGTVSVEKAVVIDTNKYDAEGNATGNFYNISYTSTTLLPEVKNGIVTFKNAGESMVNVFWDMCMTCTREDANCLNEIHGGAGCTCTCGDAVPGHKMYMTSTAVPGTTAIYPGEIPEFTMDTTTYTKVFFKGWSRTPGGEVESELVVTEEDMVNAYVMFYPVYDVIFYTFEVTTPTGEVNYYTADELTVKVVPSPKNSKVKLLRDFVTSSSWVTSNAVILDLNGYDYIKFNDGSAASVAFSFPGSSNSGETAFIIMSSRPGSDLYNVGLVNGALSYGKWFHHTQPNCAMQVQIGGTVNGVVTEELNFFGGQFFYDEDGRNSHSYSFTATNANFYQSGSAIFFDNRTNINVTFTDCTIVTGGDLTRHYNKSTNAVLNGTSGNMVFTNCEIITKGIGEGNHVNVDATNAAIVFDNCRVSFTHNSGHYDSAIGTQYGYILLKNGTVARITINNAGAKAQTLSLILTPEGSSFVEKANTKEYTAVKTSPFTLGEDGKPTFAAEFETQELAYTYEVVSATKVNWYYNGEIYATTYEQIGAKPVGPVITYVIEDDMLRNGKYVWTDENGSADITIGDANEYNFYAVKNIGDYREYTAGVKDARYSLVFYTQFHSIFYFPAYGLDAAPMVGSTVLEESSIVYINDVPYYTQTSYHDASRVGAEVTKTVTFVIDGVTYTQSFKMGGFIYADIVLSAPASEVEALAIANMVRYINTAILNDNNTDNDTTYADQIAALIGTVAADGSSTGGKYDLPAYVTEYPDEDVNTISNLADYFSEIRYGMYGTSARFMLKLKDGVTLTKDNVTFYAGGVNPGSYQDGQYIYTYNIKVYEIAKPMTITVTIPGSASEDSEDATATAPQTITATFSIGAYLAQNPDVEIVKALYAFGVSAEAYKKSLIG